MSNRSMLEDELRSPADKIQKNFGVKYIDDPAVFAPLGHVYSVFIEELKITEPNLPKFIEEFNTYISRGGDGWAKMHSPLDNFSSRTAAKLSYMLYDYVEDGKMTKQNALNIIISATGGHPINSWVHAFR